MRSALIFVARWVVCLGLPCWMAACTGPGVPAGSTTVTPDYVTAGGKFTSGGGIYLAAKQQNIGGRLGVCGAWTRTEQSTLSKFHNRHVLDSGIIYLDGERLVQNLNFMAQHKLGRRLGGRQAACVTTGRAWRPADADRRLVVRLPRRSFRIDADKGGTDGTWFYQTAPIPDLL